MIPSTQIFLSAKPVMPNSNNYLEYFMRDKIFKLTISKYVSYFKNFLLHKVENVTIMNEAVFHKTLD